ncbi:MULTISPECIES: o-succinylbenzoate synthase [Lysinibacillus]|uniref:o-succinylbenzoate synthase n=1 Tax=Lysinibacillus fusiformis TaxID=28031 RepID=A0A2I0UX48_9BACI|nr:MULTISPECIES: o-succinylbenzoate synthase [Lysinibacillus]KUF31097.1 o-succinylbenzoate synthase [Lysinibacillus sp. F5]PKU50576.1 o-succinylbenzoate synthase [Lysinibacillus fusiformis]
MRVEKITLRHLKMPMKTPFTTSFGTVDEKELLLVEARDESGITGWGETVAFVAPWYTEETLKTTWHMLQDFLIPILLHKGIGHPDEVNSLFAPIRRNCMAKASIEGAVWDIYAQLTKQSLAQALGGQKQRIEVGVSVGIQPSTAQLIEVIKSHIEKGYKRVKIKIKPGYDVEVVRAIRAELPDLPLMVDANSAYTLEDINILQQLDDFRLLMIEQPLATDDIVDHATLQKKLKTPICLDESITSFEDARRAIELGSCGVINIKIGRVGGLTEAKRIHDLCKAKRIPVWCGGMLEAGIGRAHNIALTSLSHFILPGDTAGSSHYWYEDIIDPEVVVKDGYIEVSQSVGIGYAPNMTIIDKLTISTEVYQ